jgi:hypothetical protein
MYATNIIAHLHQGSFPLVCHAEPVEASLSFPVEQGIVLPILHDDGNYIERERIGAEVKRRLSVVEELSALVTANLQRATHLRQSILQQAFEVKLVPVGTTD